MRLSLWRRKKSVIFRIVDEDFHLVGLVSDRNIRDASPSIFRSEEYSEDLKKPLSTIMRTDIITGHPLDFVEEVAAIFCENKISCLPVVKEKKLAGILTSSNLFTPLLSLLVSTNQDHKLKLKYLINQVVFMKFAEFLKTVILISLVFLFIQKKKLRDYKF